MGMTETLIDISQKAGDLVLKYYHNPQQGIQLKGDDSPLTNADLASDRYIDGRLKDEYGLPIISEENYPDYNKRKDYSEFFLVDPLDGTKEFIDKNGEFTVNIAYIVENRPVMGVIYAPALGITYYAEENSGAYMKEQENIEKMPYTTPEDGFPTATGSRKHSTELDSEFMHLNNIQEVVPAGSSLKFCKVAAGLATFYPRFQGSMEWDIAAGHIIAKEAGCAVIDLKTGEDPQYNKESLRNNYFLVLKKGMELSSVKIPEWN